MTDLARRFGGEPEEVELAPVGGRTLEAIVTDNAVEGCVREAFGALVATHQAMHAEDAEVRRVMATIARDETRHAALSFAIDAWARCVLDAEAWSRVEAARARAIVALAEEIERSNDGEDLARAGFPGQSTSRRMFARLAAELTSGVSQAA